MKPASYSFHLSDADHTCSVGALLGKALLMTSLDQSLIIHLNGELGAGKTTFVGGMMNALGYAGAVRSPTYTLIEPYEFPSAAMTLSLQVVHMDLYRLTDASQLDELGVRDMLLPGTTLLIEWPERAGDHLPPPDVVIHLEYPADGIGRKLEMHGHTSMGRQLLHLAYSHTLAPHES